MGAAEAHRDPEALSGPDTHIGTHLPWRGEECEREQVTGHHRADPLLASRVEDVADVVDLPGRARIRDEHAEGVVR